MRLKAIKFRQGTHELYVFCGKAKELWSVFQINKRTEDKDEGYQRALSDSRAQDIKRYVEDNNPISPAIVVALDESKVEFDEANSEIIIDDEASDAGWVIDGQHRLRGAELADKDVELPVVAFLGLDLERQIQQFVTINREAKGVPTSLYYDLLKLLPRKRNANEIAKEKAAAIAESLRKDPDSTFYNRIVVVTSPKKGELSLNNFVRKISPMIVEGKGSFAAFSQKETAMIIENYFKALKATFPEEFSLTKQRFFQTLGFGAVINALHSIFNITIKETGGFRVQDVKSMLERVEDFNFSDWDTVGSGNAAELQAGKDFEAYFKAKTQDAGDSSILRLE